MLSNSQRTSHKSLGSPVMGGSLRSLGVLEVPEDLLDVPGGFKSAPNRLPLLGPDLLRFEIWRSILSFFLSERNHARVLGTDTTKMENNFETCTSTWMTQVRRRSICAVGRFGVVNMQLGAVWDAGILNSKSEGRVTKRRPVCTEVKQGSSE